MPLLPVYGYLLELSPRPSQHKPAMIVILFNQKITTMNTVIIKLLCKNLEKIEDCLSRAHITWTPPVDKYKLSLFSLVSLSTTCVNQLYFLPATSKNNSLKAFSGCFGAVFWILLTTAISCPCSMEKMKLDITA